MGSVGDAAPEYPEQHVYDIDYDEYLEETHGNVILNHLIDLLLCDLCNYIV